MDLADYTGNEGGSNRGYILVCIDIFSRYLYTRTMTKKTATIIWDALQSIFDEAGAKPEHIFSDREPALLSEGVSEKLHSANIDVYHVDGGYSNGGSPIAERVIRTIKEKLEVRRDVTNGRQWKNHVKAVTEEYNSSVHRTLKTTPNEAKAKPEATAEVQHNIVKENHEVTQKAKFQVGDIVLLQMPKSIFEKGYMKKWDGRQHYRVESIDNGNPKMYRLDNGHKYYAEQMQKIDDKQQAYLNSRVKGKNVNIFKK